MGRIGALGAGMVTPLALALENTGDAPWPGLAPLVPGVVVIRHRWRDAADAAFTEAPILCDLAPGARCTPLVGIVGPRTPGPHELEIGLAQHEGAPIPLADGATRVYTVEVRAAGRGTR